MARHPPTARSGTYSLASVLVEPLSFRDIFGELESLVVVLESIWLGLAFEMLGFEGAAQVAERPAS
jgi:hypothetical protein